METISFLNILGCNVFNSPPDKVSFTEKKLLNTFSPSSYGLPKKDAALKEVLQKTDRLVSDGMGIGIGAILLHGKILEKIVEQDCFNYFTQNQ